VVKVRVLSALLFVSLVACNTSPESEERGEMTATVMGARGLYTSPSQTAGAPPGSAVVASNVVVPRPGVYETRRGYSFLGDRFPSGSIESMTEHKGVLIGYGGGMLARYDEGAVQWVPYGYTAPALGPVVEVLNQNSSIPPTAALNGDAVPFGSGTVTLNLTVDGDGNQWFTWTSTSGIGNSTPQPFSPTQTVALTTTSGTPAGISVTWGDESYATGDIFTVATSGGTPATTYLPPNGPLKNPDGTLLTGRVRFHETGGCLYFTTSKGVFRLEEPTGTPYLSGISEGLIGTASLTGTSGFLADGQSVAYRETWSKRTPDGRIIEGAPSGRTTIFNTVGGGASRNVSRTIPIPKDLPPDAFLRVWRTESFPNALGPGEDFAQVHEKSLADMVAGAASYTFTDITPDAIRGNAAYFSASLGDGLLSSKFRPPLATDVLTFRDSTVYVGATGLGSVDMTLLSVTAFTPYADGLVFTFGDGLAELYTGVPSSGPVSPGQFAIYTSGTPSQNIEQTTQSLIRAINSLPDGRLRAFYASSDNGTPGAFRVEARNLDETDFTVRALGTTIPWVPALRTATFASISGRDGSGSVTVTTSSPHGLVVGQVISVLDTPSPTYNIGEFPVSAVSSATEFKYVDPGPVSAITGPIAYRTTTADLVSERQGGPAFAAWAPLGEPDAVPVLQYVRVGKDENPVLGGLVLGNSLYLRKADGLYRLSGDTPAVFGLDQVDTTVSFIAPYAAFTLGGNAYSLTTEGMKVWTESGRPTAASVAVETDILDVIVQDAEAVGRHAFAVNYESDRTMLLWLPSEPDATSAGFAYRYNYLTDAWTTEETSATCAIVSPSKDKLFVGSPTGGVVLEERKDRLPTDYRGPENEGIPSRVIYSPQLGSDPSLGKHFNRMKYHVDPDVPVPTEIDVSFETDWGGTTPTEFSIPGEHARGHTFETLAPYPHRRGTRLYVGVAHDTPGEKLALLGYSVTFYEHALGAS
jgi:hypothetical protein